MSGGGEWFLPGPQKWALLSPASLLNWGLRRLGCGPDHLRFWSQGLRMEELLLHKKNEAEQEAYPTETIQDLAVPQTGQNGSWLGVQVDISHVGGSAVTHRGAFFLVQETKLTHMFSTAHASKTERTN